MKVSRRLAILPALLSLCLPACHSSHAEEKEGHGGHDEHGKIVATSPVAKEVTIVQPYVCQIRAQSFIEVQALNDGYLEEIAVKEGQVVQPGEVLFKVLPTLYKARLEAEAAEAKLAEIEFLNTKRLYESTPPIVSVQELNLAQAKLDKANARLRLAMAEMEFTNVKARFGGIVDRQLKQLGSLVEKKDVLTTLSDNSVMRAYFNVPEARYLEDQAGAGVDNKQIDLMLADGGKFQQACQSVIIEGQFDSGTGNIAYRADFPNPNRLLRHGQTGTILVKRKIPNAMVIPQRATFEVLDKRYVFVVGEDHVVHQRLITVLHEQDDVFIVKSSQNEAIAQSGHGTAPAGHAVPAAHGGHGAAPVGPAPPAGHGAAQGGHGAPAGHGAAPGEVLRGLSVTDKIILEGVKQVHEGQKIEFEFQKPEETLADQKHPAQ